MKHAPLPWYRVDNIICGPVSGNTDNVASVNYRDDSYRTETAAFIARACNSHYELVEALEMFITAGHGNSTHFGIQAKAHTLARAALAKAKGEA